MIGGESGYVPIAAEFSAEFADVSLSGEEPLGSKFAQSNDNPRTDYFELFVEIGFAAGNFARLWVTVAGGTAFENVADVDFASGNLNYIFNHASEHLSRSANEGDTLRIFVPARGFAHK